MLGTQSGSSGAHTPPNLANPTGHTPTSSIRTSASPERTSSPELQIYQRHEEGDSQDNRHQGQLPIETLQDGQNNSALSTTPEEDVSRLFGSDIVELSTILNDPGNKLPVSARRKVLETFERLQHRMIVLCMRLSRSEGQIKELRTQLADSFRKNAEAQDSPLIAKQSYVEAIRSSQAAVHSGSSSLPVPRPFSHKDNEAAARPSTPTNNPNYVLHLAPLLPTVNPGPEITAMLKSTFGNDPSEIGVKQVKLIPTRSGLTVVSADQASIGNLQRAIESHAHLKTALKTSRPPRRLPQFKISGVDPSVVPALLRSNINARNNLNIPEQEFKHRTYFKDRSGNNVHIVEVSPSVYRIFKDRERILVGWTSCPIKENFYVAACDKCCTYGHVATRCNAQILCCAYCADSHASAECPVTDQEKVVCRECRAAGRRFDHAFNAPCCFTVAFRISRLKAKTTYDLPSTPALCVPSTA